MRTSRAAALLLLAMLWACSGGGKNSAGEPAPAAGPGSTSTLQLRLRLPDTGQARADGLSSVEVEVVVPGSSDPGTLSGRTLLASGHAEVGENDREVFVSILGLRPGPAEIVAFGRTARDR